MFHKLSVKMPQSVHKCRSDDPRRCLKEKMVECGREGGDNWNNAAQFVRERWSCYNRGDRYTKLEEVFSCQLLKSPLFLSEQAVRV